MLLYYYKIRKRILDNIILVSKPERSGNVKWSI